MLAAALAVVAAHRVATGAIALAAAAVAVRWGTTSLAAVGGAQAVLGPAVLTGPPAAAASSLFAALTLVLLSPAANLRAVAVGVAAAQLAVGPAGVGGIAIRSVATACFVVLCLLARHLPPWRLRLSVGVGAAAFLLAAVGT